MANAQSSSAAGSDKSGGGDGQGSGGLWAIVVGGAILALAGYLVFGTGSGSSAQRAGSDPGGAGGAEGGANAGPRARRADSAMNSRASSPAVQRATTELATAAGGAAAVPDAPKTPEERTEALVEKLEKYKKRATELESSLAKHDEGKAKFIATYASAVEGEKKWQSQRDSFEKAIASTKKQIEAVEALLEAE